MRLNVQKGRVLSFKHGRRAHCENNPQQHLDDRGICDVETYFSGHDQHVVTGFGLFGVIPPSIPPRRLSTSRGQLLQGT